MLKLPLPVDWQQRFIVKMAGDSQLAAVNLT